MLSPSENIERSALTDLHNAATPEISSSLGLQSLSIGSALVSISDKLPASAIVINRALCLGMEQPENQQTIDDMIAAYDQAGVERFFLYKHPSAQPDMLAEWFNEKGLEKARSWQKFSRGRSAVPETTTELSVKEIGPKHGQDFGRIVSDAFDLGDLAIPWLAQLPGRDNWRIFMSFHNDTPTGVGALFIQGEYAWTDYGATDPAFRQRGSQAAVLAARIQCALDAGCKETFTCTGEDIEGDPQHSYKNIKKLGFVETYLRENYAPPKQ